MIGRRHLWLWPTALFIVALGLRLWHLGTPNTIVSDEVSFVREGYDYVIHQSYFDPHPPLGKLQLGAVFAMFGYSPFTWRILNAIEGALIIPLLWWLGWRLTHRRSVANLAAFFTLLDGLLLVDSRLGLINVPYVLYALVAFACVLKALNARRPLGWLLTAGVAIGAAISVKWLAVFMILPAIAVWCWPKFFGQQQRVGPSPVRSWLAVGSFLLLPAAIYVLVFVIHYAWLNLPNTFWSSNAHMLNYHLSVPPTGDPNAQSWWGWLLMYRPFPYWTDVAGLKISAIRSLPNPWIWWTGGVMFVSSLIAGWRQPVLRLLNIFLLAAWLPFALIQRVMYSYHAIPFDMFLLLLLAVVLGRWWDRRRGLVIGYLVLAVAVFIWFAPWYLNIPLSQQQQQWRRWLPMWSTRSN